MASKTIVVVGITGNQGGSVGDVFLQNGTYKVRGVSRNAASASAKPWTDKGVEMVSADVNDLASLKKAFAGATAIFGVTDFWTTFKLPTTAERAEREGRSPNEVSYDIEVQQGKNIVDAAAAVLKDEGKLERLVLSTLTNSRHWSGGKVTWNFHFDAKWAAVEYLRETYPDLNAKTSLVQAAMFVDNYQNLTRKQPDGSYVLRIPANGDRLIPLVHARRDIGHFVQALVDASPGKHIGGHREMISFKDLAKLFGKVSGKETRFEQSPSEELEQFMPGGFGKEMAAMFTYMGDYGYYGGDPSIAAPETLGIKLPSVEDYLKEDVPKFLAS